MPATENNERKEQTMVDYTKIIAFVQDKHKVHPFAGFDHVERVHNICLELAKGVNADIDALRVAAYLHDIAVPVLGPEKHHERAREIVGDLLNEAGVPAVQQEHIFAMIKTHTRYTKTEPLSVEAAILKDADGIDYLGAIGIMRAVMRSFRNNSYAGNVSGQGKQILANLLDNIEETFSTAKGKEMAKDRIDFINMFIKRLDAEINV